MTKNRPAITRKTGFLIDSEPSEEKHLIVNSVFYCKLNK